MTQYVLRRLLLFVPVIIGVSILTFVLMRIVPGDVAAIALGQNATPEALEEFREANGLDRPLPIQYLDWLAGLAHGDFGDSYFHHSAIRDELAHRLPVTGELMIMSVVITLLLGIPAGVIAGVRPNTWSDYVTRTTAVFGLSIPNFWLGTLLILLPAIWFNWTPPFGRVSFFDEPGKNLVQFILPSMAIGISSAAGVMRLVRSSVLEVLRQDYVRTAWSKGLPERTIIWRHVLKNGLIPVATLVGLQVGTLLGGAVIAEQIFALPGMGLFTLQSILGRDYLAVQAIVVLAAVTYAVVNLMVDVVYVWFDPRIRYA